MNLTSAEVAETHVAVLKAAEKKHFEGRKRKLQSDVQEKKGELAQAESELRALRDEMRQAEI